MMGHLKLAPQWLKHLLTAQTPRVWREHEGQGPEPLQWTLFSTQVISVFLQAEAWQQGVTWGRGCCWNVLVTLRSLFSLTRGLLAAVLIWPWHQADLNRMRELYMLQSDWISLKTADPWPSAPGRASWLLALWEWWMQNLWALRPHLPKWVFTPLPCQPGPWRENS